MANAKKQTASLRWERLLRVLLVGFLLLGVGYFLSFKRGLLPADPVLFGGIVLIVCLGLMGELGFAFVHLIRGRGRTVRSIGRVFVAGGLLTVGGGGMANWLLSYQGFVVLTEGEGVPLVGGTHLSAFDTGPLVDLDELDMTVGLVDLEFEVVEKGLFRPVALLEVLQGQGQPERLRLPCPGVVGHGPIRLHGGAFGFTPRIVVLRDDQEVFDSEVPFLSERSGPEGISFTSVIEIPDHDLKVLGRISLLGLSEQMQGHPTLWLQITRAGEVVGSGSLEPGHFATISDDLRVGFAGVRNWVEVDISRRTYQGIMMIGLYAAMGGGALWLVGLWVRRS